MLIIREGYLKKKLIPFIKTELAQKTYLRVYIFALVILMVEQQILGKLFLKTSFRDFIKSMYESKTAGAVLLKMMIQHLPIVLYLFDEKNKEEFFDESSYLECEHQVSEDEDDQVKEKDQGILGGLLSRGKKGAKGSEQPLEFFVKFIFKCLKVCDEKRKIAALQRIDLIMKRLGRKSSQEKVYLQMCGFLKSGYSPEVSLRVLGLLLKWKDLFHLDFRRSAIGSKLEEFLQTETLRNVQVYEAVFELWESLKLDEKIHRDMSSKEYEAYVKVLEILFVQKPIGENLAHEIHLKWGNLLLILKEKNEGLGIANKIDVDQSLENEPIVKMFLNYTLTDYEVGELDGQERKQAPVPQKPAPDHLGMDIMSSNPGPLNSNHQKTTKESTNAKALNFNFEKKETKVKNEDLLDLTNFSMNPEAPTPFENKKSSKRRSKKPLNILESPGLKLKKRGRKKKQKKAKNNADDLLDFSLPNDAKISKEFDLNKLKDELSLFEKHKRTKEDSLIDSFFDSNPKAPSSFKSSRPPADSSDNDKIQRYFSKSNTDNLGDFI